MSIRDRLSDGIGGCGAARMPGRPAGSNPGRLATAVKGGAIVTRLGPIVRRGEEAPVTETLAKVGMPILRTIHGTGLMEGGSFVWLNPRTAVIGRSSRVNEEGTRQVEEVLNAQGVELLRVDLTG